MNHEFINGINFIFTSESLPLLELLCWRFPEEPNDFEVVPRFSDALKSDAESESEPLSSEYTSEAFSFLLLASDETPS